MSSPMTWGTRFMWSRIALVVALLLAPIAALAQPACTSTAPNATACQSAAVGLQSTDILLGQQQNGPSRPNQSVQVSIAQIVAGGFAGSFTSLSATGAATIGPAGGNQMTITGGAASTNAISLGQSGTGGFLANGLLSITGDTTVGTNTGASARININGPAGNAARNIRWQSAGSNRWSFGPSNNEASSVATTANGAVPSGNVVVVASAAGIAAGMQISATNVPSTAYVVSLSGTSVTISQAVTGGGIVNGAALTFYPNTGADLTLNALNDVGGNWATPLSVTRSTGIVNLNNGWKINGTFYPLSTSTMQHALFGTESFTGGLSASGSPRYNEITINSDTVGLQAGSVASWLYVGGNWGGVGFNGSRNAIVGSLTQAGGAFTASGILSQIGVTGSSVFTANAGGSAPFASHLGSAFAFSGYCEAISAATYLFSVACQENDVKIDSGSSAAVSLAYSAVHLSGHASPGTVVDTAYSASDQGGTVGWVGPIYSIGRPDGVWPCNKTSGCDLFGVYASDPSLLQTNAALKPMSATRGLAIAPVHFTGNSIEVPGFTISGAGILNVSPLAIIPSASNVLIDVPDEILSAASVTSGTSGSGGCYATGDILTDAYGDQFIGTASACVLTALSIQIHGHTASPPGSAVTLNGGSGYGATATLTFVSVALDIGTTTAATIGIGNSGSTTTINGTIKAGAGTGQSVTCTIVATHTLTFTNGILTGGTCNS